MARKSRTGARTATRVEESVEESRFILEELEAAPSDFECARAIRAYIPLLEASYAFARGVENPPLPAGYEKVAPILLSEQEALEAMESLAPEAAAAVANDFRAVAAPSIEEGLEGIANPERFGFVVREKATKAIIVSIRGTQTPGEWVKNFTAIPNPFNEVPGFGLVHLGFERLWRAVRQSVFDALDGVPASSRITMLGHSLGGAMATLGTVDVRKNLNRLKVDLCTFGGPRVGKIRFRGNFNKLIDRCFRVTEPRDIVPHVPSLVTAWAHVGLQIEVRSTVGNAHSLESYLEGLKKLHGPLEAPAAVTAVRTL
jgi:triacylglycerol lipase